MSHVCRVIKKRACLSQSWGEKKNNCLFIIVAGHFDENNFTLISSIYARSGSMRRFVYRPESKKC